MSELRPKHLEEIAEGALGVVTCLDWLLRHSLVPDEAIGMVQGVRCNAVAKIAAGFESTPEELEALLLRAAG